MKRSLLFVLALLLASGTAFAALKLSYTNDSDVTADHWRVTRISIEVAVPERVETSPGVFVIQRKHRMEVTVDLFKTKTAYIGDKRRVEGATRSYVWEGADFPLTNPQLNNGLINLVEAKLLTLPEWQGAVAD